MINSDNVSRVFLPKLRAPFQALVNTSTAGQGLQKLIDGFDFESVLDIGAGEGLHSQILLDHGKHVTAIDYGNSVYFNKNNDPSRLNYHIGDFHDFPEDKLYDCAWCAHILEHQLNPNLFLTKVKRLVKEGGVIAITVPPMKKEIVGGHVTVWNAGLVLYNLVMAGLNCARPQILQYGYNITVIIKKESITLPQTLSHDYGDIEKLAAFFPDFFHQDVNGDIYEYNWL